MPLLSILHMSMRSTVGHLSKLHLMSCHMQPGFMPSAGDTLDPVVCFAGASIVEFGFHLVYQ